MVDDSSGGIEFMDSKGQQNVNEDGEKKDDQTQSSQRSHHKSPKPYRIMYIQMELCEKSTLRFLEATIY